MPLYAPDVMPRWITPVHNTIATTSQTFTVAQVQLVQFTVSFPCLIDGLAYVVGTTSAGNVTGGIVGPITRSTDSASTAAVVAQSASTAQGATTAVQVLTWTAVVVRPGIYYAALEGDNATGTYMRTNNSEQATGIAALYARAGGYGALTNPTPTVTDSGVGVPGIRVRVV